MGCCRSNMESLPGKPQERTTARKLSKSSLVRHSYRNVRKFYEYEKTLGSGSFGTVYLAKQLSSGLKYAIKEIRKDRLDEKRQMILMDEVLLLKQLDNPHIVRVYEVIETKRSLYIVTEHLEGGELFSKISKEAHFTEASASKYLKQILLALKYLHTLGIVHRDLKPENLMFLSNEEDSPLKIIDFGISTKIQVDEKLSEVIGTILYMAPEMFKHRYNEKCDIWSAGVILYLMLTGKPPFDCRGEDVLRESIVKNRLSFKGREWNNISTEALSIVKKMLTYDHVKRPSADDLLQEKWVNHHLEASESVSLSPVVDNLRSFHVRSTFEKAVLLYVSSNLTFHREEQELIKQFEALDTNKDGRISKEEVKKVIGTDVYDIMNQCDLDQDGFIEYSEFIAISKDWRQKSIDTQLKQAFDEYDLNHSGTLSLEDLKKALPGLNVLEIQDFIAEADENGDSLINFEEFRRYILEKL